MTLARRLILHAPPWQAAALAPFVEACLEDGVALVCVVGPDCDRVEAVIDELVVGDGTDPGRFLLTSAHPGQGLDAVRAFAASVRVTGPEAGTIQEVHLLPD